jgi:hypothetical protein
LNTDEKMTGDLFEVDKRLSLKPVVDFNSYLRSAFGDGACTCIRCTASGGDESGYAFQHTFSFDGKPSQRRFASTAGSDVLMALKKAFDWRTGAGDGEGVCRAAIAQAPGAAVSGQWVGQGCGRRVAPAATSHGLNITVSANG